MNDQLLLYRLAEVERLISDHTEQDNRNFEKLHEAITAARVDIAGLKARASMWGAVAGVLGGGAVSGLIAYLVKVL